MAKVSIIVPVYNVEMYLEECLESIQRQTLKDIEIICVNDGSTDSSLDVLKRYTDGDGRFIIIDKDNSGYGSAMNIGLERSTGDYVGIVEPDDYVPVIMYEDLYEIARKNDLDFLKADFYRFKTNEKTRDMYLQYNHLDETNRFYNKIVNPSEEPELIRLIMNTWSGIYRRSFLEQYHIRHHETPGASFQDNGFFWQTFIYAKRAMFLNKPYYMNRRDNPNSSVNSKEKVYAMNIEYDYIKDIFMNQENEELWERFKGYYNVKRFSNYMFTLNRIARSYKRQYVYRISKEYKRAKELDELDLSLFPSETKRRILLLIKHPENYYLKYVLKGHFLKRFKNSFIRLVGKVSEYTPASVRSVMPDGMKEYVKKLLRMNLI